MDTILYEYKLAIKSIDIIEEQFPFVGMATMGVCYLKIRLRHGTPVFLCAQRSNNPGTTITNGVESILKNAIDMLVERGAIVSLRKKTVKDFLLADRFEEKKRNDLARFIANKAIWIEHYPPSDETPPEGAFALVKFDSMLHPRWSFMSRQFAIDACCLEESFLDIPDSVIHHEDT